MTPVLIGILAYVAAQIAIGVVVSRRIKTEDDYLVAGRRLGPTLATVSIFATWFGAETCVGATGSLYADGLGATSVEPFAYGICLVAMGLVFARPMWR
ncbi:MAG: sodium:solute symporter, partial [Planctomycetota bacterium]|nr:sodium:solute symporter [Planctomycetota bacterium]